MVGWCATNKQNTRNHNTCLIYSSGLKRNYSFLDTSHLFFPFYFHGFLEFFFMLTLLSQKKKSETLFPRGEMCSIFLTSFFFVSFAVVVIIIKKRKFKECKKKKKATHRMSKQLFELFKTIKKRKHFLFDKEWGYSRRGWMSREAKAINIQGII